MADYLAALASFPLLGVPEMSQDFFRLALQAIGEHWRRFVFHTDGLPFTLFRLTDMSLCEFFQGYKKLQNCMCECAGCADVEFSTVLLSCIPREGELNDPAIRLKVQELQRFLKDMSVHAPLSTDAVECWHGYTQSMLHRFRGCKVTDPVAQERVLWASVCSSFSKFRKYMMGKYLDKYFFVRLASFGHKGCNMYTNKGYDGEAGPSTSSCRRRSSLSLAKMDRMIAFDQELPGLRQLSGFLALCDALHF